MSVGCRTFSGAVERLGGHQLAGHPEMDAHRTTVVQPEHEVLASALHGLDAAAKQVCAELAGSGKEQRPRPRGLHVCDGAAEYQGDDSAPGHLDFGELGHGDGA